MIIVAGKVYVAAEERDASVAQFVEMVQQARDFPGCLDFVIAADPLEDDRVNLFECFESEERLAAWRAVASAPKTGSKPQRVEVQKHTISASGPPFP